MFEEPCTKRCVAGERRPRRPALTCECRRCRLGLGPGGLEVAADEGCLGQHQPCLGGLQRHRSLRELGDGLLGGCSCLGDEPNAEQQLAPVAHPVRERHTLRAAALLRAVVVVQCRRHVPAPCRHPADVVLDLGEGQVQFELGVDLRGRDEVVLGGAERAAIRVDESSVVQRPRFPEPVAMAAEDGQRAAVAVERLVEPVVVVEEDGALELEPRARDAAERAAGGVDLAEGAARVAGVEQGAAEAHARLCSAHGQLGAPGDRDGSPQVHHGALAVPHPECCEAERALRDRQGLDIPFELRPQDDLLGEHLRAPGRVGCELDSALCGCDRIEVVRVRPHVPRA